MDQWSQGSVLDIYRPSPLPWVAQAFPGRSASRYRETKGEGI